MPDYDYECVDRQGGLHRGQVRADSLNDAIRRLQDNGRTIVEVTERRPSSPGLLRRRLRAQDVTVALHELATLLEAGVSLGDAVLTQSRGSHHALLAGKPSPASVWN